MSCGIRKKGNKDTQKHDWIVDKFYYFMLTGEMEFTPQMINNAESLFNGNLNVTLRNLENAKKLGRGFHDIEPFYNYKVYPQNGEIDIIGFRDYSIIGIEVKLNGMDGVKKQIKRFHDFAGSKYPEKLAETYYFSAKNGLYLVERDADPIPII